jgi:hypothetical protein
MGADDVDQLSGGLSGSAEVARGLGEVIAAVDGGELRCPAWLRDRIMAARVALDVVQPRGGHSGAVAGEAIR